MNSLPLLACCWLCSCLFTHSRVPIPGCFSFFTAIGHVFNQPDPMISMPTSPSESLLLFTPWNQLNFDVTGFNNTQASRDNRSCHFHAQLESSITLLSTDSVALALSRALSCRLNDAFNITSFLHGSNWSCTTSCETAKTRFWSRTASFLRVFCTQIDR